MNNAANNIDAKSKSLKDILFERHYKVGYFQREYKWTRSNVEDLIVDLERSFNANWEESHTQKEVANYDRYYMGPIVLFQDNAEFSIVDGQQRLTSFMLLMIFLNHEYKEVLKIDDKYRGYIYSDYFGTESYNMNIEERNSILDSLYKNIEINESSINTESALNIFERYTDIMELFPNSLLDKNILPLFTNWLTEKLVFIEILTQTSESAYTIFETMNDRGLNLTQTELLKSFLLSNVKDESKIKELDTIWKNKIRTLNAVTVDNDQDFFKAWLRAKYAISIRTTEKGAANEDFEKIGTRFSSWTQENTKVKEGISTKLLLDIKDPSTFYFFVKSDFDFFSDIYLKLQEYQVNNKIPEHRFRFMSFKGISTSLSYPLIMAPLKKTDDEDTINKKINAVINYLDCLGVYRLLLNEPITHSSIRTSIYLKVKDFRNNDLNILIDKLKKEVSEYKSKFLIESYTRFENTSSKYILARLHQNKFPNIEFEKIYFQRWKDSFSIYQFLKIDNFESEKQNLPKGLKEILVQHLCSYCIVPKQLVTELDNLSITRRIEKLLNEGLLNEFTDKSEINLSNLKDFFILRERKIKESILDLWKIS